MSPDAIGCCRGCFRGEIAVARVHIAGMTGCFVRVEPSVDCWSHGCIEGGWRRRCVGGSFAKGGLLLVRHSISGLLVRDAALHPEK